MAQGEMYTSFSNGEEWAGAELFSRHNPEASVDSVGRYSPEQNSPSYHTHHAQRHYRSSPGEWRIAAPD